MPTSLPTQLANLRVGQGIDVHPFAQGRRLVLGGVEIPHAKGLLGHSDADALLHAITDALLGAAGKPDIGCLFPNTDNTWKGANSLDLLGRVMAELTKEGWVVINVDCTILAEAPKMSPHIPAMKKAIAPTLKVEVSQVGIKATTTEKLGFVGREEGITALAVALLTKA